MSASVCVRLSVPLSVCLSYLPNHTPDFCQIFVHVAVARSSSGGVMLSQGKGAILRVFFSIDNALYGSYSGMNFATKDRIYFFTVKSNRIQFPIVKRHICDYFEITRKLN